MPSDPLQDAIYLGIEQAIEENYRGAEGGYLVSPSAVAGLATAAALAAIAEQGKTIVDQAAPAPATVFLALGGDYDAYGVRRVFAHREHAAQYKRADTVEEWQIDTAPVETRTWIRAIWSIRDPAAPEHLFDTINYYDPDGYSEVRDYDGNADAFDIDWWPGQTASDPWEVQISGWNRALVDAAWKERRDRIVAAGGALSLPLDQDKTDHAEYALTADAVAAGTPEEDVAECVRDGHDFDVIASVTLDDRSGVPVAIRCGRCGAGWGVASVCR